jgi:hypothetical protein
MAIHPLVERCEPRAVELTMVRADRLCLSDRLIEDGHEMPILAAAIADDVVTLAVLDSGHVLQRIFARAAELDVVRPC